MKSQERLTSWIEWYRLARRTLELDHLEATRYADARFLEEMNRSERLSAA